MPVTFRSRPGDPDGDSGPGAITGFGNFWLPFVDVDSFRLLHLISDCPVGCPAGSPENVTRKGTDLNSHPERSQRQSRLGICLLGLLLLGFVPS